MNVDMVMPQMGESIAEATISRWLKAPGDRVEKDELILEISTDKVDSEIPAPAAGVLTEILFKEGDVVPVKQKIATINTAGDASAATAKPSAQAPSAPEQVAPQPAAPQPAAPQPAAPQQAAPVQAAPVQHVASPSLHVAASSDSRFYSPVVRSLAEKHGISDAELAGIPGSGQGGRVTKQDFQSYLDNRGSGAQAQRGMAAQAVMAAPQQPSAGGASFSGNTALATTTAPVPVAREYKAPNIDIPTSDWAADGTKVVPMDNMRRLIAEHMVRSKKTSPHVYSIQEVDCSQISAWRAKYKNEFKGREGFSLSFTPFFLEAAVRALLQFPIVNSSVDGNTVIMKKRINLGCAVALGNSGLIVPVIKSAEERNFVGLARGLNDLALRARNKQLLPDEVAGGTFTVTNPGIFGTMIGTPIINQPQVAILCLGEIKKRPVVINDMIAIREICYLTLSYDHRIIDGAVGGQFLAFIREYLEGWDMDRPLY